MKDIDMLHSEVDICDVHVNRLEMALRRTSHLFPLHEQRYNTLSEEEIGFLELLTSRFAKLQDVIGQKIFPLTLKLLQEDLQGKTFIDILNRLEKIGALKDVSFWSSMREVRNSISHEYPEVPELVCQRVNACRQKTDELLAYWESFKGFISSKIYSQEK